MRKHEQRPVAHKNASLVFFHLPMSLIPSRLRVTCCPQLFQGFAGARGKVDNPSCSLELAGSSSWSCVLEQQETNFIDLVKYVLPTVWFVVGYRWKTMKSSCIAVAPIFFSYSAVPASLALFCLSCVMSSNIALAPFDISVAASVLPSSSASCTLCTSRERVSWMCTEPSIDVTQPVIVSSACVTLPPLLLICDSDV